MQDYTITLPEDNNKAIALLNYLKTLDFVKITKTTDWWDEINQESKKVINRGLDDFENGNIHTDKEVRQLIHQRISKAQTK